MRVLINGIAGFGGSAVARALCERGYSVRGLDTTAPSHAVALSDIVDKIDYRWKSLSDISRDDVRGCSVVLHFSAQADVPAGFSSPKYTVENNVSWRVETRPEIRPTQPMSSTPGYSGLKPKPKRWWVSTSRSAMGESTPSPVFFRSA